MVGGKNVSAGPPGDVPAWYHAVVEAQRLVDETVSKGAEVCTRMESLTKALKESTNALAGQLEAGVSRLEEEGAHQRRELSSIVRVLVADAREASVNVDPAYLSERRKVYWLTAIMGVLGGVVIGAVGSAVVLLVQPGG